MPLTLTQITDLLNPIVQEQDKQRKSSGEDDLPAPPPPNQGEPGGEE